MKRYMIAAVMAMALFALTANAVNPPWLGPPWPWGQDCTEWAWYGEPWGPTEMVYNPDTQGFYICGDSLVVWPTLDLELFIEWEIEVYFAYTHVQVHLASYYDPWTIEIDSNYIKSNDPSQFQILPLAGYTLDSLNWISPVVPGYTGTDCPITSWQIRVNGASWTDMQGGPSNRYWVFTSCDNYFDLKIVIDPEYHQSSGYYKLEATLCPLPPT